MTCIYLIYTYLVNLNGFTFNKIVRISDRSQLKKSMIYFGLGLKIDSSYITKTEFDSNFATNSPVILTNVFDFNNELWTEELINLLGDYEINFDIRKSYDAEVESFQGTLRDYVAALLDESNHDESWYMMDESILESESSLSKITLPKRLFGFDWFQYFPSKIRPKTALIIGGEGARSFLHADPYEWTGWNYLLEGRKLCE